MAKLSEAQIEKLIYPVSFYRNKAVHVKATCRKLLAEFGGVVPSTMDELLTLPGVGRKTANLVRIVAHRRPDSICVDTHVHRIANRFGWVRTRTPEQTERALYEVTAKKWWARINLYLVTWGQHVCKPVYPLCPRCPVLDLCPRIGVTRVGKRLAATASVESGHASRARHRLRTRAGCAVAAQAPKPGPAATATTRPLPRRSTSRRRRPPSSASRRPRASWSSRPTRWTRRSPSSTSWRW